MARRIVNPPPVEAKLPPGLATLPLESTLEQLVALWHAEPSGFDPAPYVERIRSLPDATRTRLAELVAMIELDTRAELNREAAAKQKIVADAVLAVSRMPEALDLLLLLLVRASYNVSEQLLAIIMRTQPQVARGPLFAMLFRTTIGTRYEFVDALEKLGIDDAMIDQAIGALDRVHDNVAYMLSNLLMRRHDVGRAFTALVDRFNRQTCAHHAAYAVKRRGKLPQNEVPRLHKLLRVGEGGVPHAAAVALAAIGDDKGRKYLERMNRELGRM